MNMQKYREINTPYKTIEHKGIAYGVCTDYDHISRYRSLRQVTHNVDDTSERFIGHETVNPFRVSENVKYYKVPTVMENRLDLIAEEQLGSAGYAWIIAYFNDIEDGYTVQPGQTLKIPQSITSLFANGEILQNVSPFALNLSQE